MLRKISGPYQNPVIPPEDGGRSSRGRSIAAKQNPPFPVKIMRSDDATTTKASRHTMRSHVATASSTTPPMPSIVSGRESRSKFNKQKISLSRIPVEPPPPPPPPRRPPTPPHPHKIVPILPRRKTRQQQNLESHPLSTSETPTLVSVQSRPATTSIERRTSSRTPSPVRQLFHAQSDGEEAALSDVETDSSFWSPERISPCPDIRLSFGRDVVSREVNQPRSTISKKRKQDIVEIDRQTLRRSCRKRPPSDGDPSTSNRSKARTCDSSWSHSSAPNAKVWELSSAATMDNRPNSSPVGSYLSTAEDPASPDSLTGSASTKDRRHLSADLLDKIHLQAQVCSHSNYSLFPQCNTCLNDRFACQFVGFRVFMRATDQGYHGSGLKPDRVFVFQTEAMYEHFMQNKRDPSAAATLRRLREDAFLLERPLSVKSSHQYPDILGDRETCAYLAKTAGPTFLRLLTMEIGLMEEHRLGSGYPLFFRAPLPFVRQECDGCSTSLFNFYWTCGSCGVEICNQCRTEWRNCPQVRTCNSGNPHRKSGRGKYSFLPVHKHRLQELLDMKKAFTERYPNVSPDLPIPPFSELSLAPTEPQIREFPVQDLKPEIFRSLLRDGIAFCIQGVGFLAKEKWNPAYFLEHFGEEEARAVDCRTDTTLSLTVGQFFVGFTDMRKRLFDDDEHGQAKVLKIKDWPAHSDFETKFPQLFRDFMDILPIQEYTGRSGRFNLWAYQWNQHLPADLGPKMYNAYRSSDEAGGHGTTNLHADMSDALNVMMYTHDGKGKDSTKSHGESGATWDIYPRHAVEPLRNFLKQHAERFNLGISDPIHDQCFYLNREIRDAFDRYLKERMLPPIKPYRFYQRPGDAIVIPAGCPHQVCNQQSCIKVATDFVFPENVDRHWQLMQEFRLLPAEHLRRVDILQIKQILYDTFRCVLYGETGLSAACDAINSLHS